MSKTDAYGKYPSLKGRVVVVTGGASGIGEAIVEAFAEQGSRVAFMDLQKEAGEALVRKITGAGHPTPLFLPCDLTDIPALQRSIRTIEDEFHTIDVLVNNAGDDTRHSVESVTPGTWDNLMAVNLKHQFFMCQGVVPLMQRAGRGSIINMSSISWTIPSIGLPVYVMAKAAIAGMTRTLAHEFGKDDIRVNCVMPGAIITERQQRLWLTEEYKADILKAQALKRLILPEEVARLVLFLAADDSASITNQCHVIDGGWI